MTERALWRAILLAVLVAATCRADEITDDYAAATTTDRPESTEDDVSSNINILPINSIGYWIKLMLVSKLVFIVATK